MYNGPAQEYVQAERMPPDMANVDWQHKPSQFKLYQHCKQIRLPYGSARKHDELSLTLEGVGEILSKSYGLLQESYAIELASAGTGISQGSSSRHHRRPVPSGGALFPCEIYLFSSAGQHLPAGVYHYDVAHHALDILAQHDVMESVCSCLAHPDATRPACILAMSCFFWKDGFKYGDFSY